MDRTFDTILSRCTVQPLHGPSIRWHLLYPTSTASLCDVGLSSSPFWIPLRMRLSSWRTQLGKFFDRSKQGVYSRALLRTLRVCYRTLLDAVLNFTYFLNLACIRLRNVNGWSHVPCRSYVYGCIKLSPLGSIRESTRAHIGYARRLLNSPAPELFWMDTLGHWHLIYAQ